MSKNTLFLFLSISLLACNNIKQPNKTTDSTLISKRLSTKQINNSLEGKWCALGDTTSSFSIKKNEIYYYDALEFHKFSLVNDLIKIKFDDYDYDGQIKLIGKDTLLMIGKGKFEGDIDTLLKCSN
ncbi:MAG: hypothetical protein ABIN13_18125 [Mucilaginibacter sp.]